MKNILFGIVVFVVTSLILFGIFTPTRTVEVYREHSFVVDRNFKEVRRVLFNQDLVTEILESHGAKLISKEWVEHDFLIQRPLMTSWEYNGTMLIVAKLDFPRETIHMKQEISLRSDEIYAKSNLDRPLKVGVTDWDQEIWIVPHGDKTEIRTTIYAKLSRPIPKVFMKMAKDQMNFAVDDMIAKFQPLLTEAAMKDVGLLDFTIPVKP